MTDVQWWRGAVIYQVYPRSLMDSNGDGIGDLPGIIEKLDYIASLGVDAIWISPFFKSPMQDFGYDISDYRNVDPIFGELDDLDRLINKAHQLGLRIIIDQVLSHTSDQHAWFQESRSSRDNPKADWYVWVDPRDDGSPPNNWLAIFGGVAWEWEPRRGQYYLHNFLKSQPDLNYHCPAVQQAILDEVEFWLRRGIDGLRLDAITFCFHDKALRDNPAKPAEERKGRGFSVDNPYAFQRHIYNNDRPETLLFMERLRELLNRYDGTVTLGEISTEDSLRSMAEYTADNKRLHMAYSFELLSETVSPSYVRETVENLEDNLTEGWPCWAHGNHDVRRVLTRWGGQEPTTDMAKMFNALLLSLRGSVCTYQGEELGLTEAPIEHHQLQDPYGITFWPMFKGRDGCRTPMPWSNTALSAGFSSTEKTWLPLPEKHREYAVDVQDGDDSSVLNHYREFIRWRKQETLLRVGDIRFIESSEHILAFYRDNADQRLLAVFNFSDQPQQYALPENGGSLVYSLHPEEKCLDHTENLVLPAYGSVFIRFS